MLFWILPTIIFIGWAKTDPNKHVNTSTKEKMILIARYKYAKKKTCTNAGPSI
jgi:hypothetical protein